jgi:regulator of protease activity HflC (stomatin/prohibitin superfamily)
MEKFFSRIGKVGAGLFATGIVFTRFIFVVDGGERGVVFDRFRGVVEKVYGEGMHFMIPLIQVSYTLKAILLFCPISTSNLTVFVFSLPTSSK